MLMVTRPWSQKDANISLGAPNDKFTWLLNDIDYVRSYNKLKTLYLHLPKTHGHQTREGTDFQW